MDQIIIQGEQPLRGDVRLSGSKNSSLPVLAATLLASRGECLIHNLPDLTDVATMLDILRALGARITCANGMARINAEQLATHEAPFDEVRRMRASFYVAGPLLGRLRRASVPLPGGCLIGTRPVDFHIDGFRRMGAASEVEHGRVVIATEGLHGANLILDARWSSLGATINLMLAAALADGITTIEHASREPELVECARFLNLMGARVSGQGTSTLVIEGVRELHGCEFTVVNDRMEAGTYLLAGAATRGEVTVGPIPPDQLSSFTDTLSQMGVRVETGNDFIRATYAGRPKAIDVITGPWPGFPTDLQAPVVVFMSLASGRSVMRETIYERRFAYVDELRRFGADIKLIDHSALAVRGVSHLTGAPVQAPDIRAGAALVIAGLASEGETTIGNIGPLERGYDSFVEKLNRLGARVHRMGRQRAHLKVV